MVCEANGIPIISLKVAGAEVHKHTCAPVTNAEVCGASPVSSGAEVRGVAPFFFSALLTSEMHLVQKKH